MLTCCEYGLLALEGPTDDPAAVGPHGSEDDPADIMGTGDKKMMEMGTGERNRQCAPPTCARPARGI